jgi:hypothetical protein
LNHENRHPRLTVSLQPENISHDDPRVPARLRERLGADAPPRLAALDNLDLLSLPKAALFCSTRCPGHVILFPQAVSF